LIVCTNVVVPLTFVADHVRVIVETVGHVPDVVTSLDVSVPVSVVALPTPALPIVVSVPDSTVVVVLLVYAFAPTVNVMTGGSVAYSNSMWGFRGLKVLPNADGVGLVVRPFP
jgi:hypothetical protein